METTPHKIAITKPSITELEIEYVNDAIRHGWGSKCYDYIYRFENQFAEYLDSGFALATSSCTGAIHLALLALGIKEGDEVIVPDITWIASVEPILYIKATPVFVDVLEDTWCIDPQKVEQAITAKTKAILVVHLYGNLVNMDAIMDIAHRHRLKVVEDAAEGLGSEFKSRKAGSIGDIGVFSFHGTKTVVTGEGGMLTTDQQDLFDKARILNDHGRNPKDGKTFWMRNYGYKYKMSNLQAAMGCAQIERVDELVGKKREIFQWYTELFAGVQCKLNPELQGTKNSYWMPTAIIDKSVPFNRDEFFSFMKSHGIDSRPFFYPLSTLPMFERCPNNKVSYDIFSRGINLPSYHDMNSDDAERVATLVKRFISE